MIIWMSFVDPEKPQGSQFLGVVIVESDIVVPPDDVNPDLTEFFNASAVRTVDALGVNPGGLVKTSIVPDSYADVVRPHLNKLLTKSQCDAIMVSAVNAY